MWKRIKVCSEVVLVYSSILGIWNRIKVCSEVLLVYSSIFGCGRESRFVVRFIWFTAVSWDVEENQGLYSGSFGLQQYPGI